jgi:hypothetical protein
MPKQEELEKKTAEYRLKFPILFKVDAQQISATSDKELDALLNGPIGEVLDNIDKTEANVNDESLKVWKLRGKGANIVQLTKDDMGVVSGDTLDLVVEKYAAEDKTTGEVVTQALMALSMVADVIALVSGPMGVALAGGLSAVAAVAQVVQDYRTFSALGAAGGVALDPDAAKMAAEEPDLEGLIYALAMAGIAALTAAGGIRNASTNTRGRAPPPRTSSSSRRPSGPRRSTMPPRTGCSPRRPASSPRSRSSMRRCSGGSSPRSRRASRARRRCASPAS